MATISAKTPKPFNATASQALGGSPRTFFFYGISYLAVLSLAAIVPNFAVILMVILVAGQFLINWKDYIDIFTLPTTGT